MTVADSGVKPTFWASLILSFLSNNGSISTMILHELRVLSDSVWLFLLQITPFWALGLFAGSLVSVFLSEKISQRFVALSDGRFRLPTICGASLLGVLSPLCMFGTVPVIAAFSKKNVPQHLLAAFMVGSVLLNPNIFLLTFALGTDIALARLGFSIVGGVIAGCLVMVFRKGKPLFDFSRFGDGEAKKKRSFFADLFKAFRITAPYLMIGIVLSALFSRYVPPDIVARAFGARHGLGVLFATSLSVPLYACGGGVIPLIRAWMFAGMGAGDAMAFMIAGPATKITNISAVKMIFAGWNFVFYLVFCLAFAVLAGVVMTALGN